MNHSSKLGLGQNSLCTWLKLVKAFPHHRQNLGGVSTESVFVKEVFVGHRPGRNQPGRNHQCRNQPCEPFPL